MSKDSKTKKTAPGKGAPPATGSPNVAWFDQSADVPLDKIKEGENPRIDFDLDALKASVKKWGVLFPILVDREGPNAYRIISGHRRFRSAKAAGLSSIPVRVLKLAPGVTKDAAKAEIMAAIGAVENFQRKDLTAPEVYQQARLLVVKHRLTPELLGDATGMPRGFCARMVNVAVNTTPEVAEALKTGAATFDAVVALSRVPRDSQNATMKETINSAGRGAPIGANHVNAVVARLRRALKSAPFKLDAAPGCAACKKRTSDNADLFNPGEPIDSFCGDPKCYAKKGADAIAAKKEELKAAGATVLDARPRNINADRVLDFVAESCKTFTPKLRAANCARCPKRRAWFNADPASASFGAASEECLDVACLAKLTGDAGYKRDAKEEAANAKTAKTKGDGGATATTEPPEPTDDGPTVSGAQSGKIGDHVKAIVAAMIDHHLGIAESASDMSKVDATGVGLIRLALTALLPERYSGERLNKAAKGFLKKGHTIETTTLPDLFGGLSTLDAQGAYGVLWAIVRDAVNEQWPLAWLFDLSKVLKLDLAAKASFVNADFLALLKRKQLEAIVTAATKGKKPESMPLCFKALGGGKTEALNAAILQEVAKPGFIPDLLRDLFKAWGVTL